ncbi:hypothetical protein TNCV_4753151 [Trichonephila clavipes]|nr:hypothetical protein TNCV_4753151 [Trichonephila clavipes]
MNLDISKDFAIRIREEERDFLLAVGKVKIPITERRSPDIQRRKPIKYQAGMRSRHSGTRTCRRYGSSWESSR